MFSGPNNLCIEFSRHSPQLAGHQTYRTHFRAIDSACSSMVLEAHDRCSDGSRAVKGSNCLDSGRTNGMISSSAHRREQRRVQLSATCLGIATPMIFSRCFPIYSFSWETTNSVAPSAHDAGPASNFCSTKSSRYVGSRIAMAIVVLLASEKKLETPT